MSYMANHLKIDGIYVNNINDIYFRNYTSFDLFVSSLKRIFKSKQAVVMGKFSSSTASIANKLLDLHHVSINASYVLNSINNAVNPFDPYFANNQHVKKYIWSLNYAGVSNNSRIVELYLILFSLPGITLIKGKYNTWSITFS